MPSTYHVRTKPLAWSKWNQATETSENVRIHTWRRKRVIGYYSESHESLEMPYENIFPLYECEECVERARPAGNKKQIESSLKIFFFHRTMNFTLVKKYFCSDCLVPCEERHCKLCDSTDSKIVYNINTYLLPTPACTQKYFSARTQPFPSTLKEELMILTWHPDRLMDWCFDLEELAEFSIVGV